MKNIRYLPIFIVLTLIFTCTFNIFIPSAEAVVAMPEMLTQAKALQAVSADSPPVITTQPMDCAVFRLKTAMFSVTAVGSEPLNYQWQKSVYDEGYSNIIWSDIIGANSSDYSFIAQENGNGIYRVLVSNNHGSVTSDFAKLYVLLDRLENKSGGGGGCNSGGVLGIITLLPALMIFCRKKN